MLTATGRAGILSSRSIQIHKLLRLHSDNIGISLDCCWAKSRAISHLRYFGRSDCSAIVFVLSSVFTTSSSFKFAQNSFNQLIQTFRSWARLIPLTNHRHWPHDRRTQWQPQWANSAAIQSSPPSSDINFESILLLMNSSSEIRLGFFESRSSFFELSEVRAHR